MGTHICLGAGLYGIEVWEHLLLALHDAASYSPFYSFSFPTYSPHLPQKKTGLNMCARGVQAKKSSMCLNVHKRYDKYLTAICRRTYISLISYLSDIGCQSTRQVIRSGFGFCFYVGFKHKTAQFGLVQTNNNRMNAISAIAGPDRPSGGGEVSIVNRWDAS